MKRSLLAARVSRTLAGMGLLLCFALPGCTRSSEPGAEDVEEVARAADEVPDEIRIRALELCARLGKVQITRWSWDTEDNTWEMALSGLDREAELDLHEDGSFSELELAYELAEIEAVLPEIAKKVRSRMLQGQEPDSLELSLRKEEFLDRLPTLLEAWPLDGVVLEFQNSRGDDFETDSRGKTVKRLRDDVDR